MSYPRANRVSNRNLHEPERKVSEKVYCEGCVYYNEASIGDKCEYADNIEVFKYEGSYRYEGYSYKVNKFEPRHINKNNDCKWFKKIVFKTKKWWRFWG